MVNHAPPPAQVTLEQITADCVDLYRHIPPPGDNTPISVEPFPVEDLLPTEDKIKWAVKRMRKHRSGRPSEMRSDHLKGWLAEAHKEETAATKAAAA